MYKKNQWESAEKLYQQKMVKVKKICLTLTKKKNFSQNFGENTMLTDKIKIVWMACAVLHLIQMTTKEGVCPIRSGSK